MAKISSNTKMKAFVALSLLNLPLLLLLHLPSCDAGIPDQDLENAIAALRSHGYHLFGNAISTSDVRYEILSGVSFTFFSPIDAALFSLDMSSEASDYVQTLRYHVALHPFSIDNLRTIPSGSFLETLLPGYDLLLGDRPTLTPSQGTEIVTVDGVGISVPDLYRSATIVVHGLEGILSVKVTANRSSTGVSEGRSGPSPANWTAGSYSSPMLPKIISPEPSRLPRNVPSTGGGNSTNGLSWRGDVQEKSREILPSEEQSRGQLNNNGDKHG